MRFRDRWSLVLVFFLVFLLFVGVGLLFYGRVKEVRWISQAPQATPYVISLPSTVAVNSPITKQIYADGLSARYLIHGTFVVPFEKRLLLQGLVQLSGDPKQRVIPMCYNKWDPSLRSG